jgi:hypothetical protein
LIEKKQIRRFGLVAFIFFGCLCALGIWKEKPLLIYFFGVLSMMGIGFIFMPTQLKPVHAVWLKIAHFIGRTFTTITLTLAYYLVITPFGLIKRFIGGPILPVNPGKYDSSYWVSRVEPSQPKERFFKRY